MEEPRFKLIKEFLKKEGIALADLHTSGHATVEDLKAFANALKPKTLIPIHTFCADRYNDLFDNVQLLRDKEVLAIRVFH